MTSFRLAHNKVESAQQASDSAAEACKAARQRNRNALENLAAFKATRLNAARKRERCQRMAKGQRMQQSSRSVRQQQMERRIEQQAAVLEAKAAQTELDLKGARHLVSVADGQLAACHALVASSRREGEHSISLQPVFFCRPFSPGALFLLLLCSLSHLLTAAVVNPMAWQPPILECQRLGRNCRPRSNVSQRAMSHGAGDRRVMSSTSYVVLDLASIHGQLYRLTLLLGRCFPAYMLTR